jgi:hypothetical protein
MARPPLAMGTHGSISVSKLPASARFVTRCRFRDLDGVTRVVERRGPTKTKALTALQDVELITHRPDTSENIKLVGMRASQ